MDAHSFPKGQYSLQTLIFPSYCPKHWGVRQSVVPVGVDTFVGADALDSRILNHPPTHVTRFRRFQKLPVLESSEIEGCSNHVGAVPFHARRPVIRKALQAAALKRRQAAQDVLARRTRTGKRVLCSSTDALRFLHHGVVLAGVDLGQPVRAVGCKQCLDLIFEASLPLFQ